MKKTFYSLLLVMLASIGLYSCEEGSVGSSISQMKVEIVMDSSFTITGQSTENSKVQSRTITQLLGKIKADNYGELNSDFVTQFMPSLALDTVGVTANTIDSVKLILTIPKNGFVGDSVAPMRVSAYKLNKQLPSPIYSNFDPKGYYSNNDLLGSVSYTASALGKKDSLVNLNRREVKIPMPKEFGKAFFTEYKQNQATFASPVAFAKYFPGVYVTTTYGNGRVMHIENTIMEFYYRKTIKLNEKDTTFNIKTAFLATTPEIITNNNINLNISQSVKNLVAEGKSVIQAPAGLDVKVKFPLRQILDMYNKTVQKNIGVINNLYFEIPITAISSAEGINPPPYLLLVRASEKDKFFAENSITNDISSYYAAYSKAKKAYIFSDMRSYILDIINNKKGEITDADEDLVLTPIGVTTETSTSTGQTTIINIAPYVDAPAIAILNLDKAKIKITISKQSVNF